MAFFSTRNIRISSALAASACTVCWAFGRPALGLYPPFPAIGQKSINYFLSAYS